MNMFISLFNNDVDFPDYDSDATSHDLTDLNQDSQSESIAILSEDFPSSDISGENDDWDSDFQNSPAHGEVDEDYNLESENHLHPIDNSQTPEQIDISQIDRQPSFKGHSQSEINRHITDAKHDIGDAESDIRHFNNIANSKARMGDPHEYEDFQIRNAERRLNEAKHELHKWQHTKPE